MLSSWGGDLIGSVLYKNGPAARSGRHGKTGHWDKEAPTPRAVWSGYRRDGGVCTRVAALELERSRYN